MDSSSLQEIVRPQDTKTHASIQLHRVSSLDALRPHKAEVLGYVSAQRSISPDLLHPLDLLSRRSSSFHHMGTSCSKSSSVGLSAKAHAELRSSSQSVDSPYLVSSPASRKPSHSTRSVGDDPSASDLIQAHHQDTPSGQLQAALAASTATAVLSEAAFTAATAVANAPAHAPSPVPTFAQQSFHDATVVYSRPLDRPSYNSKAASRKNSGATGSLNRHVPFPEALQGVAKQPSQEAFMQLLQHHLFNKQDMKVMELDNIVAAMTGQSAQTEATCASLMVAHGFFFAAMKAVFVFPEVLRAVLEDIKLQVDVRQPDKVDSWFWAEADLKLLLQQFRGLKVTQQYKLTQKQLIALGPEGKAPLARVEMEMLGKVVNDFLAQLGPQLSSLPAAAEAATGVSHPGNDTSSSCPGLAEDVSGMTGVSLGSTDAVLGTRGERLGSQAGQQQEPRGAVTVGPGKSLTNSQVKKKNGLQKQREQLRAGERRKRQQAASLGVSPTVVARSQMSARSVAQQQVLTQRQRREGPTAVAQQAAAEKLQMEQQALERDYEQLRQERLRYEKEEQWAAQQQAQPSLSQPQTQSRFAQEQASQLRVQQSGIPQQADVDSNGNQSYGPAKGQNSVSMSLEGAGLSSSLLEGYRMQQRAVPEQDRSASSRHVEEEVWSVQQHQPHAKAAPQHTLSEFEQQGGAAGISPLEQSPAAYSAGDLVDYNVMSGLNPRGGHRPQHSLSELEHQGSWVEASPSQQGFPSQPSVRGPSPQELELVAAQAAPGRDSPTRDLTKLEQQGSFTLSSDPSQVQQGQQGNPNPAQAGQAEPIAGAELAHELARRKGAQADLERQYSQLQLQHQQSLERQRQAANAQQAQRDQEARLQQEAEAAAAAEAEQRRSEEQRMQQEQERLNAELSAKLAQQQAEEEERRQQQALAREAKELARQRAQLEAQLAAERGTAQGHGYSPTPLVTPKAAKGRRTSEDEAVSEVEEEPTSDNEEEVQSEAGASVSDVEEEVPPAARSKAAKANKDTKKEEEEVYSSVDSESDQAESEEYQEDFEEDEEQQAAASQKNRVQSSSQSAVARKV